MFDGFIHDLRIFGNQFYRLGGFHRYALQGIGLYVFGIQPLEASNPE